MKQDETEMHRSNVAYPSSASLSHDSSEHIEVLTYTYRPDESSTAKPFALSCRSAENSSVGGSSDGGNIGITAGGAGGVGTAISRTLATRRVACRAQVRWAGRGTQSMAQL